MKKHIAESITNTMALKTRDIPTLTGEAARDFEASVQSSNSRIHDTAAAARREGIMALHERSRAYKVVRP